MGIFIKSEMAEEQTDTVQQVVIVRAEKKKRPRVDLTVAQKQEICRFYEKNPNLTITALQNHFCSHFGLVIGRSTIGTILKRAEDWNSVDFPENVKRTCSPKFAALERDVFDWICEAENPVPHQDLVLKATELVQERKLVPEWNTKIGWATSFKRRFNLILVPIDKEESERGYRPGKMPVKGRPIRRVRPHIGRRPGYSPKMAKTDTSANTSSIIYDAAVENILQDMDEDYDDDDAGSQDQSPDKLNSACDGGIKVTNVVSQASTSASTNIIQEAAVENILPGTEVHIMHPGDETFNNTVSSTGTEVFPVKIRTTRVTQNSSVVSLPSAQSAMRTLMSYFEQNASSSQEDLRHLQALDAKLKWLSAKEALGTLRTFMSASHMDFSKDIQHLHDLDQKL